MFKRILTSALFAGAGAGLIAALLQIYFLQPVLLVAEAYEIGEIVHLGMDEPASAAVSFLSIDIPRDGLSIVFTMLIYTGYALMLLAAMSAAQDRGARICARSGVVWGLAGFVAFHMAPAFSLAPELPGAAHIDLTARQIWWFSTVAASAFALWLIAFGRGIAAFAFAAVLLLAPHVIGAPHPESFIGAAPPELASLFAARALGLGLLAWILLGAFAGYFWAHSEKDTA